MKRTHITITGDLGSGKSLISRLLESKLGYRVVSTGAIQRRIAAEHGMNTLELNKYSETHPEIDEIIDNAVRDISKSEDLAIIDSRLAWFFIPESFKVYLSVDVEVAARRIFNDDSRTTETYESHKKAVLDIAARKKSENKRYITLYGADCNNMESFDLLLDTSDSTPEEVVTSILNAYEKYCEKLS